MGFLRRTAAAEYVHAKYGHCSKRTLDKLAVIGGGPEMVYAGRIPLYTKDALDRWALGLLGAPVASTSEHKALRPSKIEAA
jgi:hypothetical protein